MVSRLSAWGFSTPARCTGWRTHPEQYSGQVTTHLAWGDQAIRARMLPGQVDVTDQLARQPQLPAGGRDQPGPAIGCCRVTRSNRGPTEGLFEEAEGVLDGKAPQVPAPEHTQVGGQRTADP